MACEGNTCGTGGWGGPKPGDPDNSSTVLSATPAFGGIDIRWNYPTTNPHAVSYVIVYRAIIDDFDAAIVRANVSGDFYYDKCDPNILYYYWIRFVSINGTSLEPIGPVSAAARPTIEGLIEELTGKIDSGVLATSLRTEIQRIEPINLSILQEVQDRINSNVALGVALDAVRADVGAAITLVSNEVTARTNGDNALVTSINTIAAGNNTNAAAIISEQNVRISADEALGQRIDTTYATLTNETQTKITAAVQTETTARVAQDSALASQITTLQAQVGTDIQGAIQNEATLRLNADSALGTRIDTMAVAVGNNTAAIQNEATARATAISAETTSRNTQFASVTPMIDAAIGTEVTNRNNAITAAVQTETTARVNADSALAGQITTAQSTLQGNITSVQTSLQTNINTVDNKVTSIGALYTAKVTVNGLIGGFGVYNDGTSVEAGFDVDTFWIGRTSSNKRKPFIVVGSETFIDEAVINKLTFTKLRDEAGTVVVENGKLKAAYIEADQIVAKHIDVKSATSGERVEFSDTGVRIYDSAGTLRVKLGNLA